MSAVPYRRTFARLLSFLRPYKRGLVISIVLAIGSQAAQIALIWVTGKNVIDQALVEPRHAAALALRRRDRRPRLRLGRAHERPPAHLRQAGARRRDGPAAGPLLALRAPLLRLLRPQPDRPADVPRDGRPAGRPLLPRLRPDLLLPERPHRRLGDHRPLLLPVAARARRARGDAVPRRARLPLQPRRAPDASRRAAEARRRRDGRGGEHRRRPRRQGVRAGAGRGGEVPPAATRRSSRRRSARTGSARPTSRSSRSCRCSRRRPCCSSARGWLRTARSRSEPFVVFNLYLAMLVMPLRSLGMWVGQAQRATASGERIFQILDEPEDVARPSERGRAARRATARSASRTSRSRTCRAGRCSSTSTSTSTPGRRSRSSATPVPARRRSPRSCRASTTSTRAACSSTASTSAT